ncbi:hypothetical protein CES86_3908 [Brucella lupini]|uniref:Uncharacterized protein n=1 Tax=Brucella lupini TaxID=255457 RepID=A0A256GHM8_9HYPH|nr:hypothetical protein CES86_3908 [Brucella lupini]
MEDISSSFYWGWSLHSQPTAPVSKAVETCTMRLIFEQSN